MSANLFTFTGGISQALFSQQQADVLESAFGSLLSVELNESRMDARGMGEFAGRVAASVSDHFEQLSAALPLPERECVERIATSNGIRKREAMVEYLSNACIFQSIRSYFELPKRDVMVQVDHGGFLVFTWNGSMIASPPGHVGKRRTFHYTRMPSRTTQLETSSRDGELLQGPAVGRRLKTSEFTTSPVRNLLYIPATRSQLFAEIHNSMVFASVTISQFITGKP